MVIRDLESRHLSRLKRRCLPPQARHILLLAASLHIREGKGITVGDLEKLGFRKHNAEKQLQDARRNGLLVPGEIREGKQKQYYLSNYKYVVDERAKRRDNNKDITAAAAEKDITLKLAQVLSNRKYTYHNIHLETNLCHDDDYESLGWNIPSQRNKQKVAAFKLELRRKCSFIVSANGTVNIAIECTLDPFKLHTPAGLIEFIGSCGQALNILQQSAAKNRLNVVPPISEWHITQFDYNKDIPTDNTSHTVLSWTAAYGRLKVEYLGTIFQIYPKGLPEMGICTRFEGHYSTREKKRLEDTLSDIIDDGGGGGGSSGKEEEEKDGNKGKRSPFITAEEMLLKHDEDNEVS